jgi:hypothetical protein
VNAESIKSFVTYYLQSLSERTRREKSGTKWGIDWVAYNLGLAKFGKPVRLPFLRSGELGYPKSKVEAEFGIDLAFLSDDERRLVIFVLKDEPLTNKTWTGNDFDRDLRMAMSPDLNAEGLDCVASVTIILAYNKDDQHNGVEAYDRLVANAPTELRDNIALVFLRWNLSELVEQTIQHILSPSLLPERFFGQLSYLSAQAADFRHGTDAWEQQLVPHWRQFIDDVLRESAGTRGPDLIPVALIILRQHAGENASFETGWIDLLEWAAIALWRLHAERPEAAVAAAVRRFWRDFYIAELDRFYCAHISDLATEHSIDHLALGSYVGAVASSYVAYWHVGRLGLLSVELAERSDLDFVGQERTRNDRLNEIANWAAMLATANVAVFRPVLDIQHIEIFLMTEIWRNAGRVPEVKDLFEALVQRLWLRRLGHSVLPFLDGGNSLDNVFEQVATRPDRPTVLSQSSFFVLMLLELCCVLHDDTRDDLICKIYRCLVLGAFGPRSPGNSRPLDLMSWIPPENWGEQVFDDKMQAGQPIAVHLEAHEDTRAAADILSGLRQLVAAMREAAPRLRLPGDAPVAAAVLASLRYGRPLPPELWRRWVFPEAAAPAAD